MDDLEVTRVLRAPTLHRLLEEVLAGGPVLGSNSTHSPEELVEVIVGVLDGSGDHVIEDVTRANGLRDRVRALIGLDQRALVDWVLLRSRGYTPGIDRRMIPIKDIPWARFLEVVSRDESEQAMMVCTCVSVGWRGITTESFVRNTLESLQR